MHKDTYPICLLLLDAGLDASKSVCTHQATQLPIVRLKGYLQIPSLIIACIRRQEQETPVACVEHYMRMQVLLLPAAGHGNAICDAVAAYQRIYWDDRTASFER